MTYGAYPDLRSVQKILVIKHRHLGDVLLTGPVFSNLKKAMPEATIDAYIYEEGRPLLEGHPDVGRVLGYDRAWKREKIWKRLWKELSLLWQIRKGGYDLVLNLTEGDRGTFAAKAARAKIRVGFPPKGRWQKGLYTHIIKHTPGLKHTVERNLDALRVIGIFPGPEERGLVLKVPEEAKRAILERIGEAPFVLIHPTSRWLFKCWSVAKMREVVEWFLKEGKRVVFSSGSAPEERAMVGEITKGLDVIDLGGKISLLELAALIERAGVLLCVDSLPFHLASVLKRPVVALFGPTSDVTWGPWQNPYARVVSQKFSCQPCYQDGCGGSKYSDCLATLSVERVISELKIFTEVGSSRLRIREKSIDCSR